MTKVTSDPPVTTEVVEEHGLTPEEFGRIKQILGREPNFTELGIFSVMWSEHCSYKNSRKELRKLPTAGPNILVKAGEENAGVVDIGDGWAIAFKIESHNHPSAIEPFQGAATGVGGIIRDIFTMGARPEFLLNSLRFGPITPDTGHSISDTGSAAAKRDSSSSSKNRESSIPNPESRIKDGESRIAANRRLFAGVVSGIAHYGNCIGIPTIGGEIYFDESFEGNPLVNVFCLGVLRHEQLARGAARGVGNPVFYVGAETGRDGLAGAAFASRELTEESHVDRPAVQVGDPFKEKLLLEACLELLARGAVAGIQDMGAAGLTCSTCETASRGGSGIEIDLAKVPQREPGMTPYEILLSESQERMLIIAKRGQEQIVRDVFAKWDVPCAEIGRVTDDGMMRVRNNGSIAAEIPAKPLAEEAPLYSREARAPVAAVYDRRSIDLSGVNVHESLRNLLRDPTIASKNWVYRQYDHTVRTGGVVKPGSDAGVFFVRYANKILAATTDCNSLYCRLDPRQGARIAVAEAARNLTCSGAHPLAVTDNLNFGNPYKPENFWQLREAVEGLGEACRAFATPITGGNVSLYNESQAGVIDPTPTVGMVGLIEAEAHITTQWFKKTGDVILLVGDRGIGANRGIGGSPMGQRVERDARREQVSDSPSGSSGVGLQPTSHRPAADATMEALGGSRFLKVCFGLKQGPVPSLDLDHEIAVQKAVRGLIKQNLARSAHDCSEGGLAVAVAECCFNPQGPLGAKINITDAGELEACANLFSEIQSRIIISVASENLERAMQFLHEHKVPHQQLGTVVGNELAIDVGEQKFRWPITDLYDDWWNSIKRAVEQDESIPSL